MMSPMDLFRVLRVTRSRFYTKTDLVAHATEKTPPGAGLELNSRRKTVVQLSSVEK